MPTTPEVLVAEPVPFDAYPRRDEDIPAFLRSLGLDGIFDVHVHVLPQRLQEAVWAFFDRLDDPPWPIVYRDDEAQRLALLRRIGVRRHTALAYAHKPGMVRWLNDHTLGSARRHPQIVPTFTFFPEDGAAEMVAEALDAGGQVAKVHVQVGRFHLDDSRLDEVWPQLERARVPIVLHASATYGVEGGHEYCGAPPVADLLSRFPDLRLVIAHLGAPQFDEFLALAHEVDTLRFDTAMTFCDPPYYRLPDDLPERLAVLSDRLLFGSDFPSIPRSYADQLRGIAALRLDPPGLRALLHDRAAVMLAEVAGTGGAATAPVGPEHG